MQAQFDQLEHDVIPDGSMRDYIDVLMKDNRISALKIYGLESEVKQLRQRSDDAHRISSANDVLLMEKMALIDEFLGDENEPRYFFIPNPTLITNPIRICILTSAQTSRRPHHHHH